MLWEEFSSVLLLPPCGKFEDPYIHFNAVNCYWTQKQERSKKICLGCFLRVTGWAGLEVFARSLPHLSGLYIKLLCSTSPIAMPGNPSGYQQMLCLGLLQSLCKGRASIHSLCCCLLLLVLFSKHLQPALERPRAACCHCYPVLGISSKA